MLRRVLWFKVGGKRLHMLKLIGSFLLFSAILKVAESSYWIFVTVQKARYALLNPVYAEKLFGWAMNAPYVFTSEDVLGVLLGPISNFLFWMAVAIVALMIYESGKVVFPIEEFDQAIPEHHRSLIRKAVEAHRKKRG